MEVSYATFLDTFIENRMAVFAMEFFAMPYIIIRYYYAGGLRHMTCSHVSAVFEASASIPAVIVQCIMPAVP